MPQSLLRVMLTRVRFVNADQLTALAFQSQNNALKNAPKWLPVLQHQAEHRENVQVWKSWHFSKGE